MQEACRICFVTNVKMVMLDNSQKKEFLECIHFSRGLEEEMSEYLCYECKALLTKSYNFIQKALRAQQAYKDGVFKDKTMVNKDMWDSLREECKLGSTLGYHKAEIDIFLFEESTARDPRSELKEALKDIRHVKQTNSADFTRNPRNGVNNGAKEPFKKFKKIESSLDPLCGVNNDIEKPFKKLKKIESSRTLLDRLNNGVKVPLKNLKNIEFSRDALNGVDNGVEEPFKEFKTLEYPHQTVIEHGKKNEKNKSEGQISCDIELEDTIKAISENPSKKRQPKPPKEYFIYKEGEDEEPISNYTELNSDNILTCEKKRVTKKNRVSELSNSDVLCNPLKKALKRSIVVKDFTPDISQSESDASIDMCNEKGKKPKKTLLEYPRQCENIHTGEEPFKCKLCAAGFAHLRDLNLHLRHRHLLDEDGQVKPRPKNYNSSRKGQGKTRERKRSVSSTDIDSEELTIAAIIENSGSSPKKRNIPKKDSEEEMKSPENCISEQNASKKECEGETEIQDKEGIKPAKSSILKTSKIGGDRKGQISNGNVIHDDPNASTEVRDSKRVSEDKITEASEACTKENKARNSEKEEKLEEIIQPVKSGRRRGRPIKKRRGRPPKYLNKKK